MGRRISRPMREEKLVRVHLKNLGIVGKIIMSRI
jgi:hypothetical protein